MPLIYCNLKIKIACGQVSLANHAVENAHFDTFLHSSLQVKTRVDFSFVERFCSQTVAEEYTPAERQRVLAYVIQEFLAGRLNDGHAVYTMRVLFRPVIAKAIERGEGDLVLTAGMVKDFVNEMKGKENQTRMQDRGVAQPRLLFFLSLHNTLAWA